MHGERVAARSIGGTQLIKGVGGKKMELEPTPKHGWWQSTPAFIIRKGCQLVEVKNAAHQDKSLELLRNAPKITDIAFRSRQNPR